MLFHKNKLSIEAEKPRKSKKNHENMEEYAKAEMSNAKKNYRATQNKSLILHPMVFIKEGQLGGFFLFLNVFFHHFLIHISNK